MTSSIAIEQVAQQEIEKPKSGVGVFDLIIGLFVDDEHITQVQLREITGVEEDILLSKTGSSFQKLNDVLTNCVVKIGTIEDRQKIGQLVYDMRLGDRTFLILALRRLSLGDRYPFEFKCDESDCKAKNVMEIDISELETVYPNGFDPEDPDLDLLRKTEFDVKLPGGTHIVASVATGRTAYDLDRKLKRNDPKSLSKIAMTRMVTMNAKDPKIRDIEALVTRDREFFREFLDGIDGGVETTIQVECPACAEETDVEVALGSAGFFFPSALQKRLKRRSVT